MGCGASTANTPSTPGPPEPTKKFESVAPAPAPMSVPATPTTTKVVAAPTVAAPKPAADPIIAAAPLATAVVAEPAAPAPPSAMEMEAQRAVALCMSLNRCMVPAYHRVKAYNFDIQGLVGFDMQCRTVGVVGTGEAAACAAKLFGAFGASVTSAQPSDDLSAVLKSDIVTLHLPADATPFGAAQFEAMADGVVLLAASSASLDLGAAAAAVDSGKIAKLGIGQTADAAEVGALTAKPNVLVAGLPPAADASSAAEVGEDSPMVAGAEGDDACRVAVFSARSYFTTRFNAAATGSERVRFESHAARLESSTAHLAAGCKAVCLFVNDDASAEVLTALREGGTELVLMRCAGFDKVDLAAATELGLKVLRVPAYSPEAVAQQAVALLMTITWGLATPGATPSAGLGLDLKGTTVGVVGTGRIGYLFAMIVQGFGCTVLAYDPFKNKAIEEAGIPYVELDEIFARSDVLSIHVPLLPQTKYMINAETVPKLKKGVTLLNVSRGALVDTRAIVDGLASGQIGAYGTDVYENEASYFFDDHSGKPMEDSLLAELIASKNFQITGHQAFLTNEALGQIVGTTMGNLDAFLDGAELKNEVKPPPAK